MRFNRKYLGYLALAAITLFGQQFTKPRIKSITVAPGEPPLRTATCKSSSYGLLEINGRYNLTATEIGEYVLADTRTGNILTIYPQSKSGMFVYARCPVTEP